VFGGRAAKALRERRFVVPTVGHVPSLPMGDVAME